MGSREKSRKVLPIQKLTTPRARENGCKMSTGEPAEIFRDNLRALIRDRGLTQRQAADEIGVDYLWLRKACANGISKPQVRTKPKIEKIRAYFGIGRTRLLWSKSLRTASRPDTALYSEEELLVAIEELTWAFRLNPRLEKVRSALRAIRRAATEAADDQLKRRSKAVCELCSSPLTTTTEVAERLCKGCNTVDGERLAERQRTDSNENGRYTSKER